MPVHAGCLGASHNAAPAAPARRTTLVTIRMERLRAAAVLDFIRIDGCVGIDTRRGRTTAGTGAGFGRAGAVGVSRREDAKSGASTGEETAGG